jgi:hypothetical protein
VFVPKHQTRLERPARDKHMETVNYSRNEIYDTGPRFVIYEKIDGFRSNLVSFIVGYWTNILASYGTCTLRGYSVFRVQACAGHGGTIGSLPIARAFKEIK